MKNDRTYLIHIRDAIETIYEYLHDISYENFISNKMIIDAVVRELEIIDEGQDAVRQKLEMLVRSYDPCISCSTHMLNVEFV